MRALLAYDYTEPYGLHPSAGAWYKCSQGTRVTQLLMDHLPDTLGPGSTAALRQGNDTSFLSLWKGSVSAFTVTINMQVLSAAGEVAGSGSQNRLVFHVMNSFYYSCALRYGPGHNHPGLKRLQPKHRSEAGSQGAQIFLTTCCRLKMKHVAI